MGVKRSKVVAVYKSKNAWCERVEEEPALMNHFVDLVCDVWNAI